VQLRIIPISDKYLGYANEVLARFRQAGIRAEVDERTEKMGYKIREAETHKIPYMAVVGEKERDSQTLSLRRHRQGDLGSSTIDEAVAMLGAEIADRTNP
jgi:threonyl-tRNA synthetase